MDDNDDQLQEWRTRLQPEQTLSVHTPEGDAIYTRAYDLLDEANKLAESVPVLRDEAAEYLAELEALGSAPGKAERGIMARKLGRVEQAERRVEFLRRRSKSLLAQVNWDRPDEARRDTSPVDTSGIAWQGPWDI